jgi:hypothetical protein
MENINDLYLKYFDPSDKLDFVGERLADIKDMLEDVSYEICRDGLKAKSDW